jgi:hypothetical protein
MGGLSAFGGRLGTQFPKDWQVLPQVRTTKSDKGERPRDAFADARLRSMEQVLSGIGAAMVLLAYAGHMLKWMSTGGAFYALLNLVGSALLALVAGMNGLWAYVVLNGVWAAVSLWTLGRMMTGSGARPAE